MILGCDEVPAEPLPQTEMVAGIDMGVAWFLTTSDGQYVENPRFMQNTADQLADAQRDLARFPKKVKARDRTRAHRDAVRKVAQLHGKVRRPRPG